MTIAFYSNFMNHHQENISCELFRLTNHNYYFVACTPIEQERLSMGYEDMNKKYDFIIRPYESNEQYNLAVKLLEDADVMIFGSGNEEFFKARMKTKKLTFRYSERLLKKGLYRRFIPITRKKIYDRFIKYKENLYVLCASAYTAYDLSFFKFPQSRLFKWGYFPENKIYEDIDKLTKKKNENSIVWAGRMIDLKHPEIPVKIAKKLKRNGYNFKMIIIGSGNMEKNIKRMIKKFRLEENITMTGALPPKDVRNVMERSEIFMLTSDFNEGWGAVLNEAMNSGCVPVASHAVGSAPYLIKDGENGFLYKNGSFDDLYNKIVFLLENDDIRCRLSKNAYNTILKEWNAENAADRLFRLSEELLGGKNEGLFKDGPCSRAEILKNSWY